MTRRKREIFGLTKGLSRQESPDSAGRLSQCFIGEIMNESKNVLSLQVARERACQAKVIGPH
jgi:hypothetical protein